MSTVQDSRFMPWIDYLPEVGDPIRRRRDSLRRLAQESLAIEAQAHAMRERLRADSRELLVSVLQNWTLQQLETASRMADPRDDDKPASTALRMFLTQTEGAPLATEALLAIEESKMLSPVVMAGDSSDAEREQALCRLVEWWRHVGSPICARLRSAAQVARAGAGRA